jgi:hypothetical protein
MIDIKSQIELCKKYAKDDICIPDDIKRNLIISTLDVYYHKSKVEYSYDIYDILGIDKSNLSTLLDLYNDLRTDVYPYASDLDEDSYRKYRSLDDNILGFIEFPIWYISYINGYCDEDRISNYIDDILDGLDDKSKIFAKEQLEALISKFGLIVEVDDDSIKDYYDALNFEPNKEEADNWKNKYAKRRNT